MSTSHGHKEIEILVSPAGEARVQTRGFIGPACQDASRFLEQALGKATCDRLTPEFHQTQPLVDRQTQPQT